MFLLLSLDNPHSLPDLTFPSLPQLPIPFATIDFSLRDTEARNVFTSCVASSSPWAKDISNETSCAHVLSMDSRTLHRAQRDTPWSTPRLFANTCPAEYLLCISLRWVHRAQFRYLRIRWSTKVTFCYTRRTCVLRKTTTTKVSTRNVGGWLKSHNCGNNLTANTKHVVLIFWWPWRHQLFFSSSKVSVSVPLPHKAGWYAEMPPSRDTCVSGTLPPSNSSITILRDPFSTP